MEHACSNWVRGSVIGVGAFGIVSLAMDKASGELLAVKSIECKEERKEDLLAMENEISILKKLDSPWIVKYLGENYSDDGGVYRRNLLMEYMAGGSIADNLQRFGGPLEESVIRIYARDILKGIEYLHSQGIVHSDIKGKNVLVGDSGVKLADFGSAKVMSNERENSKVELSGTLLWMAPEVVNQVERGPPCDIWSLGCTVVEMATGRPPWTNISQPLVAMYKIGCSDELPEFPKTLSAQGHDFLQKCFHRDPKQRWTSTQLLTHPFVSERFKQEPKSPKSTLDFHCEQYQLDRSISCGTFSASIPPLSLPGDIHLPGHMQDEEISQNHGQAKRMFEASPSPRQRIARLAEESGGRGSKSSGNRPNRCMAPASNWIVVRCLKNYTPPMADSLFSDFINGSLVQKASSIQTSVSVHCNAKSQCSELKDIHCQDLGASHDDQIGKGLDSSMCIHLMNQPSSSSSAGSHGFCNSLAETVFSEDLDYSQLRGSSTVHVADMAFPKWYKN
ncbi:hypothetical protein SUGI_0787220 [Cryptomeria japonica]|nr:hypothetical protein SUGI_0787220 [Cryptomeria japonica]